MDSVRGKSVKNVMISMTKVGKRMQLNSIMLTKRSVSRSIRLPNAPNLIPFRLEDRSLPFLCHDQFVENIFDFI